MLVIRVELHSAVTHKVTELARAVIFNRGDVASPRRGNYTGKAFRGRSKEQLGLQVVQRTGEVLNYPRLDLHVWNLVARMLTAMGYK